MIKTLSKAQKMEREKFRIPRSVQDAIPIRRIFADGIFQVGNQYSKTWSFTDIKGKRQMYNIDKPQERRKATGTGGIPPENIRLRRTLTTEYLQLSLCYGVRDRMSIETAGFTGWR